MTAQTILPANSVTASSFDVANSVRFDRGSSPTMIRTIPDDGSTTGDRNRWTFSTWIKRSSLGTLQALFGSYQSANYHTFIGFNTSDQLDVFDQYNGSKNGQRITNRVFRDVGAFYHLCIIWDKNNGTDALKIRIFVNGLEELSFATSSVPGNATTMGADNQDYSIGKQEGVGNHLDAYLCETVFQDGVAQNPVDALGEFDSGSAIFKPIDPSGVTFGTNGFYLDFQASGNLGNDANGGTDYTETNIAATDQSTDTCTNNFATLNPLGSSIDTTNNVLKEGNLQVDHGDGNYDGGTATFGFLDNMSGKWYWEVRNNANTGSSNQGEFAGIAYIGSASSTVYDDFGTESYLLATTGSNIIYKKDNSAIWTLTDPSGFSAGDIINVALDLDNNKIWFGLNGTFYDMSDGSTDGDPTGSNGATVSRDYDYLPYFRIVGNTAQLDFNFGSPAFAISSGNSDANGHGNFEYAVPSGYFALNTKNLAEHG